MDASQIVEHDGHEIRLTVVEPYGGETTFKGKYEVRANGETRTSGIVVGPFATADQAEGAALKAACDMIARSRQGD